MRNLQKITLLIAVLLSVAVGQQAECDPVAAGLTNCAICFTLDTTSTCIQCQSGFYLDQATGACVQDANCANCFDCSKTDSDPATCVSCFVGYGINDTTNQCEICQTGFVQDKSTNQCVACGSNCLGCDVFNMSDFQTGGTITVQPCMFCKTGHSLDETDINREKCVADPKAVNQCGYGCQECTWDGYVKCTACETSFELTTDAYGFKSCQIQCPLNCVPGNCYYDDWAKELRCFTCEAGFTTNRNGNCITQVKCPVGQYAEAIGDVATCKPCPLNTASCQFDAWLSQPKATYCQTGYFLDYFSSKCLKQTNPSEPNCGEKLSEITVDSNQICQECNVWNCQDCQKDIAVCSECETGYKLVPDIFDSTQLSCQWDNSGENGKCSKGFYFSSDLQGCAFCPFGCDECIEEKVQKIDFTYFQNKCSQCQTGFYNDEGYCVSTACWQGAVFDDGKCRQCPDNCQECFQSGTGLECIACFDGYNFGSKKECQFSGTCPAGFVVFGTPEFGQFCSQCPMGCTSCSFDASQYRLTCTACETDLTLNSTSKQCQKSCGSGLFYNLYSGICEKCPKGSKDCFFDDWTFKLTPLSCETDFVLNEEIGICQSTKPGLCGDGFYSDPNTGQCLECSNGCVSCTSVEQFGYSEVVCEKCKDKFTNAQYYCYPDWEAAQTCAEGQYYNFETGICESCSQSGECLGCFYNSFEQNQSVYCYHCTQEFTSVNGQCIKGCDRGQYGIINQLTGAWQCVNCSANCISCSYSPEMETDYCMDCVAGYMKNGAGTCQKMRNCPNPNQYRIIEFDYETYEDKESEECYSCPSECLGCSLVNPYDIFSNFACTQCATGYVKTEQQECIDKLYSDRLVCVDGQYNKYTGNAASPWTCESCPSSCAFCETFDKDSAPFCYECKQGFFMNFQTWECEELKKCPEGQVAFQEGEIVTCRPCLGANCQSCTTNDPTNEFYDECVTCNAGFQLTFGLCTIPYTSDTELATKCGAGNFGIVYENIGFCAPCPPGATLCSLQNPKDLEQFELTIQGCQKGFNLSEDQTYCENICTSGYYYTETPPAPAEEEEEEEEEDGEDAADFQALNQCQPCADNCMVCQGPKLDECSSCDFGYIFNQQFECVEDPQYFTVPSCGHGAYFSYLIEDCQCYDENQVYKSDKQECIDIEIVFGNCSVGQFSKPDQSCGKCRSIPSAENDSGAQEYCAACTGPDPSECLFCLEGYFLNDFQQCQRCDEGCDSCVGEGDCSVCSPGYFLSYQLGLDMIYRGVCLSFCLPGQIPYVPSFYYLNDKILSNDLLQQFDQKEEIIQRAEEQQFAEEEEDDDVQEEVADGATTGQNEDDGKDEENSFFPPEFEESMSEENAANAQKFAIAEDLDSTILEGQEFLLPWRVVNSVPKYINVPVTLECVPCESQCQICAQGFVYLKDEKSCVFSSACPEGYQPNQNDDTICEKATSANSLYIGTYLLSQSEPGVHRVEDGKNLMLMAFSNQDETLKCLWGVQNAYSTETERDLTTSISSTLLSGEDINSCELIIPAEKLNQINIQIVFCVEGTSGSEQLKSCVDVAIKEGREVLDIFYLGVEPTDFTINEFEGQSANFTFIVNGDFSQSLEQYSSQDSFYIYSTQVYLQQEQDKEAFDREFDLLFQTDSELNGYQFQFEFKLPPFDVDKQVIVENCVENFGGQLFCMKLKITGLQNLQYDVSKDPECQKADIPIEKIRFCLGGFDQVVVDDGQNDDNQGDETDADNNTARRNRRLRVGRRLQNSNDQATKDSITKLINQLAATQVTASSANAYIGTLRSAVDQFVDLSIYPTVKSMLYSALPYVDSTNLLEEIKIIVKILSTQLTTLEPQEQRSLLQIAKASFNKVVREKVDFSTREVEYSSPEINQFAFLVDAQDSQSTSPERQDLPSGYNGSQGPSITLSPGLFEKSRIVSVTYTQRLDVSTSANIQSEQIVNFQLFNQEFQGQSDFTFSEFDFQKVAKQQICFDIPRNVSLQGECAWFNYQSGSWNNTECSKPKVQSTSGQIESVTCCCNPHETFSLAQFSSQALVQLSFIGIFFIVLSLFI